jgi:hypothetical protein
MFRKKRRCQNLSPSPHPSYHGRQCEREQGHDAMCRISVGPYKHYWRQEWYERLGQAITKQKGDD